MSGHRRNFRGRGYWQNASSSRWSTHTSIASVKMCGSSWKALTTTAWSSTRPSRAVTWMRVTQVWSWMATQPCSRRAFRALNGPAPFSALVSTSAVANAELVGNKRIRGGVSQPSTFEQLCGCLSLLTACPCSLRSNRAQKNSYRSNSRSSSNRGSRSSSSSANGSNQ